MSGAAGKKIYQLLPLLLLLTITAASADDRDRVASLKQKALALYPEAVNIRRFLHQNPEIGNREFNTTKYIAAYLKALGIEVNRHGETYGVKAVLKGGGEGPVIGIRADMDALPIEEKNDIPFKSKNKGVMHACGHDMHMANALIAAKIASQMKSRIKGTLVFIFQPCEEFFFLGVGSKEKENTAGLHTPGLTVDEEALRLGPVLMLESAFELMDRQ